MEPLLLTKAFLVAQTVKCLQCRRPGFDPWVGKIPWRRKCNPHQHSCLENPVDGGAWSETVCGVAQSWTWLSDFTFTFLLTIPMY